MSDVPFAVCARWQAELLEAKAAKDDPTLYAYDDVYESFSECHAFPLRLTPCCPCSVHTPAVQRIYRMRLLSRRALAPPCSER